MKTHLASCHVSGPCSSVKDYSVDKTSVNGKRYCLTHLEVTKAEAVEVCGRAGGNPPSFLSVTDRDTLQEVLKAHYNSHSTVDQFWTATTHDTERPDNVDHPLPDGSGFYQLLGSGHKIPLDQTLRDVFPSALFCKGKHDCSNCFATRGLDKMSNNRCTKKIKLVCELVSGKYAIFS